MRAFLVAIFVVGFASASKAAGDETAMASATNGFYAVYRTFHPSDGVPSSADRAKYAPFLSPALERLLAAADAAEMRFSKANKGAPPLIEGDLFTSLFEGATSVQVGVCSGSTDSGTCTVALEHAEPGNSPTAWSDTVYLVNTALGWRIEDIGYGSSWDFGNKGRLSETLKQAISFQ